MWSLDPLQHGCLAFEMISLVAPVRNAALWCRHAERVRVRGRVRTLEDMSEVPTVRRQVQRKQ